MVADHTVDMNISSNQQQQDLEVVKIALLGEPGVGKTSLIFSLVNEGFENDVPPRMVDIIIPPFLTNENVHTHIFDYSAKEQTDQELQSIIVEVDVICLVYDLSDKNSLETTVKKWIPIICQSKSMETENSEGNVKNVRNHKPIILVGNKLDLVKSFPKDDQITSILQAYENIETCINVSAAEQENIVELFFAAQKTLLFPLSPLYDMTKRKLTNKCQAALLDVFKKCDNDGDGLLNDQELDAFQEAHFGAPLEKELLDDLKTIIKQTTNDGIRNDSVTPTGFLKIHLISIDKGQHAFVWQVLRKHNYDNNIDLIVSSENVPQKSDSPVDISNQKSPGRDNYQIKEEEAPEKDLEDECQVYDLQTGDLLNRRDPHRDFYKSRNVAPGDISGHEELSWIKDHFNSVTNVRVSGFAFATILGIMFFKYLFKTTNRAITS